MASSISHPCSACKFRRERCTPDCIFAPYFPPDQPQKFADIHKVFRICNVSKLLRGLSPDQRGEAVNSLAYEAEARMLNPVYGCTDLITTLEHRVKKLQEDIDNVAKKLAMIREQRQQVLPPPKVEKQESA